MRRSQSQGRGHREEEPTDHELGDPRAAGWWRRRVPAGGDRDGLELVEHNGRRAAFALVTGWLAAGVAAASVEGAAGLWLMSLPFAVLAIGAALARRRVVRVDRRGLTVRHVPFGPGYTLPRADIAFVAANGGESPAGGWSVVVHTRTGEARRLAGGGWTAERARAIADRVQHEVRC